MIILEYASLGMINIFVCSTNLMVVFSSIIVVLLLPSLCPPALACYVDDFLELSRAQIAESHALRYLISQRIAHGVAEVLRFCMLSWDEGSRALGFHDSE